MFLYMIFFGVNQFSSVLWPWPIRLRPRSLKNVSCENHTYTYFSSESHTFTLRVNLANWYVHSRVLRGHKNVYSVLNYSVVTDEEQKMTEALMGAGHVPRNSADGRCLEERHNYSGPVFTYNGCTFITPSPTPLMVPQQQARGHFQARGQKMVDKKITTVIAIHQASEPTTGRRMKWPWNEADWS